MLDETTFRRESDRALEALKQSLIVAEEDSEAFEAEENNGVLNIIFEDGTSKFVLTPNTPVRQLWISATSTSFKLEWSESAGAFVLPKTGEDLKTLTQRLLREHLNDATILRPTKPQPPAIMSPQRPRSPKSPESPESLKRSIR